MDKLNLQSYVWEPLPQDSLIEATRVLELLPRSENGTICCKLHVVTLNEAPPYEALSYCWGPDVRDREIYIALDDGCKAVVPITQNLYNALIVLAPRRVERDDDLRAGVPGIKSRLIWVDALSIDQVDSDEKARQVQLLFKIFRRAQATVLWLTNDETILNGLKPLLHFVTYMHEDAKFREEVCGDKRAYAEVSWPAAVRNRFGDDVKKPLIDYERLLLCPYWRRKWIIQELVASTKIQVQLGSQSVDWDRLALLIEVTENPDFRLMVSTTYHWRILGVQAALSQLKSMGNFLSYGASMPLFELLLRTVNSEATDPRDQIFTLLNLASDTVKLGVRPDYSTHRTFSHLYVETARAMLRSSSTWDVLYVDNIKRDVSARELPSWAPDWRLPWDYSIIWSSAHVTSQFCPGGPLATNFQILENDHLRLKGIVLQISQVGPRCSGSAAAEMQNKTQDDMVAEKDKLNRDLEHFAHVGQHDQSYMNGEPLIDVFWQTMCAGQAAGDFDELREDFLTWRKMNEFACLLMKARKHGDQVCWAEVAKEVTAITDATKRIASFEANNRSRCKRLAWTTCNALALVPERIQETDILFIAEGAPSPFGLRHLKNNEYLLLGGAYIHGYMYGEAWTEERLKDMKEVFIV